MCMAFMGYFLCAKSKNGLLDFSEIRTSFWDDHLSQGTSRYFKAVWYGLMSPITYDHFTDKIIIWINFLEKTAMQNCNALLSSLENLLKLLFLS